MHLVAFNTPLDAASIARLAERRLRESPYYFLRRLSCQYSAGVLTLQGSVPVRQLRQFAETIVLRVEGVREVDNQVEVFDPQVNAPAARAVRNAG